MTTKNIREFLESLPEEELKERGILRGPSNQLKGISLDPLILLMQEHGVTGFWIFRAILRILDRKN